MMINILDALHEPDIQEIAAYCANDLFDKFCHDLYQRYQVKPSLAYSKCTMQKGWNVKFKKSSKNLCTLYPKEGYFEVLVVLARAEQAAFIQDEKLFASRIIAQYHDTPALNGQKWLLITLEDDDNCYQDVLRLVGYRYKKYAS